MKPKPPWIREPFCGLSHFIGIIMSIVALVVLLVLSQGRLWHIIGFTIYGASLILLYTVSTLYHSLHADPARVNQLQRLDHAAIYLLIVGTYTPVCLLILRGAWGWSLLGVEYSLALVGITLSLLWKRAPDWVRMVLYIGMGWLALVALHPLRAHLPAAALYWLVMGGVIYTVGAVIYAIDRPLLRGLSAHELWHLFVLGGSLCHFIFMFRFVVLRA